MPNESRPTVEPATWEQFRDAGLLWWINRGLHLFGWVIVFEVDPKTLAVERAYPARTAFRGFDALTEAEGFRRLTDHMLSEPDRLREDVTG